MSVNLRYYFKFMHINYFICFSCRLQGLPFQVAFLAPVLLILAFNFVAFILIIRSLLTSESKVTTDRRTSGITQARRAIAILVVLGLTWLFGALAINDAKLVFQYLFCIFNSLQGLFVFIFYCVLSKDTRKKWKKLSSKKRKPDSSTGRQHHLASTSKFQEVFPIVSSRDTTESSFLHPSSKQTASSKNDDGNSSDHKVSNEMQ